MENRFVVGGEYSETTFDSMRRFSNGSAATAAALRVSALQPNVGFYNLNPRAHHGSGEPHRHQYRCPGVLTLR